MNHGRDCKCESCEEFNHAFKEQAVSRARRYDIVISRHWYWLGLERCGGRWLIGFGFGRAII